MRDPLAGLERGVAGVLLVDPPWSYQPYSEARGVSPKSAKSQYDLQSLAWIKSLDVGSLAAKDCELVLWYTQWLPPRHAQEVVEAWGFEFKTTGAWGKRSKRWIPGARHPKWDIGTGYVRRCGAEFYLIATRGNPKRADKGVRNFIEAATREHSRKPDSMYEQLERLFPLAIKYELFSRARRPGWHSAGNQTRKFVDGCPASAS